MSDDLSPEAMSIELDLDDEATKKKAIRNLSGAAFIGDSLYLANDEGRKLLHLRRDGAAATRYTMKKAIAVSDLFELRDEEIDEEREFDLEALAVDGDRLWLIGSHAMGHAAPDDSHPKQLGLKRDRDRLLFACVETENGKLKTDSGRHLRIEAVGATYTTAFLSALRATSPRANGFVREISALTGIAADSFGDIGWFTPYTLASTKENGLDIEGLAVRRHPGDSSRSTVFVGLRGPVIDGQAVIVEVTIREHADRGLTVEDAPRFHLLDLDGFGVRDLEWRGAGLLILAGPTMTRQNESALYRWRDAGASNTIAHVGHLPMRPDGGGPEVITTIAPGSDRLMLLRDGISGTRLVDRDGAPSEDGPRYLAEVYRVP
jgi:hypothetical protein